MEDNKKTTDKKNPELERNDWKLKWGDLLQNCQSELKKTTKIGFKMLSASQSNSQLHETHEVLGRWLVEEVTLGNIELKDEKIKELVAKVCDLKKELEVFENDVQEIKKSSPK